MNWRTLSLILIASIVVIVAVTMMIFLFPAPEAPEAPDEIPDDAPEVEVLAPEVRYAPVSFTEITGWLDDDHAGALAAFRLSCLKFEAQPKGRSVGANGIAGNIGDWEDACRRLKTVDLGDPLAVRAYLEDHFTPVQVTTDQATRGRFTGYYVPEIEGARVRSETYPVPLYQRPQDLVMVDLGRFRPDWKGERIAGRVRGSYLDPYYSRGEIASGALEPDGLELLWIRDPVEAFFLHIQGSGQVRLESGEIVRVGYDGHNGHLYNSLGRSLIDRGLIRPDQGSMQGIKGFLRQHPEDAQGLMNVNPSFIFFRLLAGNGPEGAQGVVLTDRRSLAVDRRFVPLGVPVWLDVSAPTGSPTAAGKPGMEPFRRLMVAQDTGSAIKGPIRGDIYWGAGDDAGWIAGHMSALGSWYMLLPKAVAARLTREL